MKILASFFVLFFVSNLFASSGYIEKEFIVRDDLSTVVEWMNKNHDELVEATHSKVISRSNDIVRVKNENVKGIFEFSLKETTKQNKNSTTFQSKFVKSHNGSLTDSLTEIVLTKDRRGTLVVIKMSIEVDDINPAEVRIGLMKSFKGLHRAIKEH